MRVKTKELPNLHIIILLILPGIYYLPGILGWIPFSSPETRFTDLLISHYPNTLFLKNTILTHYQIPLWSDLINSGAPFAANPLASLFYLPAWFGMLFPLPEGISVVLAAHAIFGAWGMYLFLRKEGLASLAAVMGGLFFAMTPKFAAHYGAGHITLLYALNWTPWLFFVSGIDREGWKTGLVAAGLFLADPRWSVPAGLIWISYTIAHRHHQGVKEYINYFLKAGITALLISSPLLISMLQYVKLSTRAAMGIDDIFGLSLPLEQLIGMLFPAAGGNIEWFIYFGTVPIILLIQALISKKIRHHTKFWSSWVMIGIFLSVAPMLIESGWMIEIPGISLLRVPARNIFLVCFSVAVVSGKTLDQFFNAIENFGTWKFHLGSIVISLIGMISISVLLGGVTLQSIWGISIIFTGSLILFLAVQEKIDREVAVVILMIIAIIDISYAGFSSFVVRPMADRSNTLIETIQKDNVEYRIFSSSYSIPQDYGAELGLRLADGVDPLQIADYSSFMEKASGVQASGYSVTIPAFQSGDPAKDNKDAKPDPYLLGLLNVKYLITDYELEIQGLIPLQRSQGQYLYQNESWLPYAWMEANPISRDSVGSAALSSIEIIKQSPNRIKLKVEGPGKLVLSEIAYPGWRAKIDNEPVAVAAAHDVLRSVIVPSGQHVVEFIFLPVSVLAGIGLAVIGSYLFIWQIRRKEK